jgi:hypothetical protein
MQKEITYICVLCKKGFNICINLYRFKNLDCFIAGLEPEPEQHKNDAAPLHWFLKEFAVTIRW